MLAALAGAAVFVRLLLVLQLLGTPLPDLHALWSESDNAFFDAWGRRVAGGDLLQREPFHPLVRWMDAVAAQALVEDPGLAARAGAPPGGGPAARARVWDLWMGGATFYQEPAYPYLVGLTYRLAGPQAWAVYGWQLALGVAGVLLVHALARRLFSHRAAAVAGALAVLAPVPLLYEVTLLRDGLVVVATLALALAMSWAAGGPRRRYLLLGLAFGGAALVKSTFLAFPVLMAAWRLAAARAPLRERLAAGGLCAAGVAAGLLPLVLRNVAVGVPALALNGSAAAMLPVFHLQGASPYLIRVDHDYVRVLLASEGSPLRALVEAARTHGSLLGFASLELRKVAYAFHGFEAPNNVDLALFRQAAPVLAALPVGLVAIAPLAAAGLARGAARAWPLLVAAAATLAGVVLSTALGRYRVPLVAVLLPIAGAGAVGLAGWARARRVRPLAIFATLALAYAAWATVPPPGRGREVRAAEYAAMGESFAARSPALAAIHLEEALRLAPAAAAAPRLRLRLGELWLAAGDGESALRHLEAVEPGSAAVRALREHLGPRPARAGDSAPRQGATP